MITFAPALEEDLETLYQLNKELIDRYEDTAAIAYDRVLDWVRDNLRENLPSFRRVLKDGELAGFYCLTIDEFWDTAELDSLFVLPQYRNQGIGTHILQEVKDTIPFPISLYVFRENQGAVRLYERMGFQITKEVSPTRYIMQYD